MNGSWCCYCLDLDFNNNNKIAIVRLKKIYCYFNLSRTKMRFIFNNSVLFCWITEYTLILTSAITVIKLKIYEK